MAEVEIGPGLPQRRGGEAPAPACRVLALGPQPAVRWLAVCRLCPAGLKLVDPLQGLGFGAGAPARDPSTPSHRSKRGLLGRSHPSGPDRGIDRAALAI